MCEAFFEWQPMKASRLCCRPPTRAHHCRAAANPSGLCSCHRPASGAVCTQLRSVRAATDGSRWQLRSRGSAGEAPAEECKGTLGCPQQWASGTGLWCRLVTLWGAGLGTWWAGRFRSGFRAHELAASLSFCWVGRVLLALFPESKKKPRTLAPCLTCCSGVK